MQCIGKDIKQILFENGLIYFLSDQKELFLFSEQFKLIPLKTNMEYISLDNKQSLYEKGLYEVVQYDEIDQKVKYLKKYENSFQIILKIIL